MSVRRPRRAAGSPEDDVVLVVDDDPTACEIVRILCQRLGYGCLSASGIEEGLEVLRRADIRVLLTDSDLVEGRITPLIEGIREAFYLQATPVVVLSRMGSMADLEALRGLGVSAVLRKPIVAGDLEEALSRAVAQAPPRWEREADVCRRLGIQRGDLVDLLRILKEQIREMLERLAGYPDGQGVDPEMANALLRSRSAALNVGGNWLARMLGSMTAAAMGQGDPRALEAGLERAIAAIDGRIGTRRAYRRAGGYRHG